ncbi:HNH endonuclease signature motif containing protein [Paenibacillus polymyxa]|uniref:HNH endonuclease signature motif containing protein n=1 Tax=Paenibacillus polymyxa TaxID=1406 RepID=UPI0021E3BC71|nr:HNH endonuclease signature motif containing protein [Paenibacillus polymyxa]
MRNEYEVRGEETAIFVKHKETTYELIIDTSDLDAVLDMPVRKWNTAPSRDGMRFYVKGYLNYTNVYFHRMLLNPPEGMVIDHIDGNPLNNRRSNLRIVTLAENNRNITRKRSRNKDLPVGVTRIRREYFTYVAQISRNGVTHFLGYHDSIADAAQAIEQFKRKEEAA